MKTYLVKWNVEVEASSPTEAAEKARKIQLDPTSIATIFEIIESDRIYNIDIEREKLISKETEFHLNKALEETEYSATYNFTDEDFKYYK